VNEDRCPICDVVAEVLAEAEPDVGIATDLLGCETHGRFFFGGWPRVATFIDQKADPTKGAVLVVLENQHDRAEAVRRLLADGHPVLVGTPSPSSRAMSERVADLLRDEPKNILERDAHVLFSRWTEPPRYVSSTFAAEVEPLPPLTFDSLLKARDALMAAAVPKSADGYYAIHVHPATARQIRLDCEHMQLVAAIDLTLAVGPAGGGARSARDRRRLIRARAALRFRWRATARDLDRLEAVLRAARHALPEAERPDIETVPHLPRPAAVPIFESDVLPVGKVVALTERPRP
jgi:hypothetical protein